MKLSHKGLLHKQLSPPQVNVLDVFECEFKPLLPPGGPERPTILLFWSSWCLSSQRVMEYMFKFSQFNNHKVHTLDLCDRQLGTHCQLAVEIVWSQFFKIGK